jgi:hypothetical protein
MKSVIFYLKMLCALCVLCGWLKSHGKKEHWL